MDGKLVSTVKNHWDYFPNDVKNHFFFNPKEGHTHSLKISPKNRKITLACLYIVECI